MSASRRAFDPTIRIGDAERNEVAEALSRHFADGRLDQTELQERLDRATSAKTRGDLTGLLHDLPDLPSSSPVAPREHHRGGLWVAVAVVVLLLSLPWQYVPSPWMPRVPWLVVGVVVLALWRRSRHRRGHPAS